MSYKKWIIALALLMALGGCASGGENTKDDESAGSKVGSTSRQVADGTKEAGKSVWGAMKDFGKEVKKGWNSAVDE